MRLAPDRIADAATALELRRSALPRRTSLGMPISVGRIVDLPRAPTDREWDLLVGELRETFHAQGKVGSSGSVRQWTNGNLHAYVEPTEAGYRLRLGTLKGNAGVMNMMGLAGMGMVLSGALLFTGSLAEAIGRPVGLRRSGRSDVGLQPTQPAPRWARQRTEQMEYIAARAQALIGSEPDPE